MCLFWIIYSDQTIMIGRESRNVCISWSNMVVWNWAVIKCLVLFTMVFTFPLLLTMDKNNACA
jgi:hypothetical protein